MYKSYWHEMMQVSPIHKSFYTNAYFLSISERGRECHANKISFEDTHQEDIVHSLKQQIDSIGEIMIIRVIVRSHIKLIYVLPLKVQGNISAKPAPSE